MEDVLAEDTQGEDLVNTKEVIFEAPQALIAERQAEEGNRFLLRHHALQRGFVSILLTAPSGNILFQEEKLCKKGDNRLLVDLDQTPGDYLLYLLFEGNVRSTRVELL